jgi:hypothetical protein
VRQPFPVFTDGPMSQGQAQVIEYALHSGMLSVPLAQKLQRGEVAMLYHFEGRRGYLQGRTGTGLHAYAKILAPVPDRALASTSNMNGHLQIYDLVISHEDWR